jgi:hypothetical protein
MRPCLVTRQRREWGILAIPDAENIRALRAALNTLGDGFVEAIDDSTLQAIA